MIVNIPDEGYATVQIKALAVRAPEQDVLEAMVREFAPSTKEDIERQQTRLSLARKVFLAEYPNASLSEAWTAGHHSGWLHFQIRKKNLFDLRHPKEGPDA